MFEFEITLEEKYKTIFKDHPCYGLKYFTYILLNMNMLNMLNIFTLNF